MVLRRRRRTRTLRESGAHSSFLAFYRDSIGLPRVLLRGLALGVPTKLPDALCVGVGGVLAYGIALLALKRGGGKKKLTGIEGNLDGVPSSEAFRAVCLVHM